MYGNLLGMIGGDQRINDNGSHYETTRMNQRKGDDAKTSLER